MLAHLQKLIHLKNPDPAGRITRKTQRMSLVQTGGGFLKGSLSLRVYSVVALNEDNKKAGQ